MAPDFDDPLMDEALALLAVADLDQRQHASANDAPVIALQSAAFVRAAQALTRAHLKSAGLPDDEAALALLNGMASLVSWVMYERPPCEWSAFLGPLVDRICLAAHARRAVEYGAEGTAH